MNDVDVHDLPHCIGCAFCGVSFDDARYHQHCPDPILPDHVLLCLELFEYAEALIAWIGLMVEKGLEDCCV